MIDPASASQMSEMITMGLQPKRSLMRPQKYRRTLRPSRDRKRARRAKGARAVCRGEVGQHWDHDRGSGETRNPDQNDDNLCVNFSLGSINQKAVLPKMLRL